MEDLEHECQCQTCPNCGGFGEEADPQCEHGDICTCTDEEKAEALTKAQEEDPDGDL